MTEPVVVDENNDQDDDGFLCLPPRKPKRPRSMRWKAYVVTWCIKMLAKTIKIVRRMDVKAYNKGSIPKGMPVFCAGGPHGSFGDPVLWGATISRNGAIIAAEELVNFKYIGWILRILFHIRGDILVGRTEKASRQEALDKADSIMARGGLVAAFPEGGIKRDRWSKSLFASAMSHKAAIVVTRFEGVDDFWASTKADIAARKGQVLNLKAPMRVYYSQPLFYEDYAHMTDIELTDFCYNLCYSLNDGVHVAC